jgi:hypothetical protein
MITTPNFRALCAELLAAIQLYTGQNPAASEMSSVELTEKLMDAMAATAAALATPPPGPPTDEELHQLWLDLYAFHDGPTSGDVAEIARAVLERWGK